MSGSIYNEGEPFNAALFLYLQPEIRVRENLKTVESAVEFYNNKKDDPAFQTDVDQWLWSLTNLPSRFESSTFIIVNKDKINISALSGAIRETLHMDGFTEEEIVSGSEYLVTINKTASLTQTNTLRFNIQSGEEFTINANNLQKGDNVQIFRPLTSSSFFANVVDIIDHETFEISHSLDAFQNIGEAFEVIGIQIPDKDRLGRINYLRYLVKNNQPPQTFVVSDVDFNPSLYRLLYPSQNGLSDDQAFLNYKERKTKDPNIIGSKRDLLEILVNQGESKDEQSITNIFTVQNRLLLNFPFDKQSGFLRFVDQDVYYITSDDSRTRSSSTLNPAFEGLITERAIKAYVEELNKNPVVQTLIIENDATFSNAVFEGYVTMVSESNTINNLLTQNVILENAEFIGSNETRFYTETVFENEIIVKQNIQFTQPVSLNQDVSFNSNVVFKEPIQVLEKSSFNDETSFLSNVFFQSPMYVQSYLNVEGDMIVSGQSHFSNITTFHNDVFVKNDNTLHIKGILECSEDSITLNKGKTKYVAGSRVEYGELGSEDTQVDFYVPPTFHTPITFTEPFISQNNALFTGNSIFSNQSYFYAPSSFFGLADFSNVKIYFAEIRKLDVTDSATFHGSTYFGAEDDHSFLSSNVFNSLTVFYAPVIYQNQINVNGATTISSSLTFDENADVKFMTSNISFNHGFQAHEDVYFSEDSKIYHKGKTFFDNVTAFRSNVIFLEEAKFETKVLIDNNAFLEVKGNTEFKNKVLLYDDVCFEAVVDFRSNVVLEGMTEFSESGLSVFNSTSEFNGEVNLYKKINVKDDAALITSPYSSCIFLGPATFSNQVAFHDKIDFDDVDIHGSAFFENKVYFGSNVRIDDTLNANEINVIGPSLFQNRVDFLEDVSFSKKVNIDALLNVNALAKFHSNVQIKDLDVNESFISHGPATFHYSVFFKNNSFFENQVRFSGKTVYEDTSTFNNTALFKKPVDFIDTVNLENDVFFHSNVYFEQELFLDDATIHHLNGSDCRLFNTIFKNQVHFDTGSYITGEAVRFAHGSVHFDLPVDFNGLTKFNDTTVLEGTCTFSNASVLYREGETTFSNNINHVHAPFYFHKSPTFCNDVEFIKPVLFAEETVFDHRLIAHNDIILKGSCKVMNAFETSTDSKFTIRGDCRFETETFFKSNVSIEDRFTLQSGTQFKSHPKSVLDVEGECYFRGDVVFGSLDGLDESESEYYMKTSFYSPLLTFAPTQHHEVVTFHNDAKLNGNQTDILNAYATHFTCRQSALFEDNVTFLPTSDVKVKGELCIDTPNFYVLQPAKIHTILSSNIEIQVESAFKGTQIFEGTMNSTGQMVIRGKLETEKEADVLFKSSTYHAGDSHHLFGSVLYAQEMKVADSAFSNIRVQELNVEDSLNIAHIDAPFITAHTMSNQKMFVVDAEIDHQNVKNAFANKLVSDELLVQTGEISSLTVDILNSKNMDAERLEAHEMITPFLRANNSVHDEIRVGYLRTLSSSNEDAFFQKQTTHTLHTSNLFVEKSTFQDVNVNHIVSHFGEFTDTKILHGTVDTLVCTNQLEFQNLIGKTQFTRHVSASNANINQLQVQHIQNHELTSEVGYFDKLETLNLVSEHQSNNTISCKECYSSNLFADAAHIQNAYMSNVGIEKLSNNVLHARNIESFHIQTESMKINKGLINDGPSVLTDKCTMCNDVSFLKKTEFGDASTFSGKVTINGQENTAHNLEVWNAQLNGSLNVNTTPFFNENVVVKGAYFGSRIGLGPYKKSLSLGDRIDMTNVAFLNTRTGTKIFARKSHRVGLSGGKCILEVSKFPNAIVQLDNGMEGVEINLKPQNITQDMIGLVGKITFVERSIYGRNIRFIPHFQFDDDGDQLFKRTTESPDNRGGYAINTIQYSILGQDIITAKVVSVSIVDGIPVREPQITWDYTLNNSSLYVQKIIDVHPESFITLYQRLSDSISRNFVIDFSNEINIDSDLLMSFILLQNSKTGHPLHLLSLRERLNSFKRNIDVVIDAVNEGFISWCIDVKQDENGSLIQVLITDSQGIESVIPLPFLNETEGSEQIEMSVFAHHNNEDVFYPSWFRLIRNANIKDVRCFPFFETRQNKESLALIQRIIGKQKDVYFESYNEENECLFSKTVPKLDKETLNIDKPTRSDIIKIDENGELLWSIPFCEIVKKMSVTPLRNVVIGGIRHPSSVSRFKDTSSLTHEFLRLAQDFDAVNVFLAFFTENGACQWTSTIASLAKQSLSALRTLSNQDTVVGLYLEIPEFILAYNSVNVVGIRKNPIVGMGNTLPLKSWDNYQALIKYNSIGYAQWMSFATCVKSKMFTSSHPDFDGFIAAFLPLPHAQKGNAEVILFNMDESIGFDATHLVTEQRFKTFIQESEVGFSDKQIEDSCAVVAHYSTKGKIKWVVTLQSMSLSHDKNQNQNDFTKQKYTTQFNNLDITVLQNGGITLGFGNSEHFDDVYDLERRVRIKDSEGNVRVFNNLNVIRLTSWGSFVGSNLSDLSD